MRSGWRHSLERYQPCRTDRVGNAGGVGGGIHQDKKLHLVFEFLDLDFRNQQGRGVGMKGPIGRRWRRTAGGAEDSPHPPSPTKNTVQ